ncbi:MAG: hypothetical protein AAGH76_12425 [Pseudomonadota bacterium]
MNEQTPDELRDPRLSALYQRISTETAPRTLDDAVLSQALTQRTTSSRWRPAVAMAASVVVAVGVGRAFLNEEGVSVAAVPEPVTAMAESDSTKAEPTHAETAELLYRSIERRDTYLPEQQEITVDDLSAGPPDVPATPMRLDTAAERGDVSRQLQEAARERAADIDREAFSQALEPALDQVAVPTAVAARLQAPPDPAVAQLLREVDFANLSSGPCATETAAAAQLVDCWRAAVQLDDQPAISALRTAIKRRLPAADWPAEFTE